jgi:hypothetical protein
MKAEPETWRDVSVVDASRAEQTDSALHCLACGLPITNRQQMLRIRGLVVHLRCAVYRRRLLRR